MNGAVLGANFFESTENRLQAVVPAPVGLSGPFHSKAAPPHGWTSMPKWVLYHAPSAFGSLALKKIPPIPVTRFIVTPWMAASPTLAWRASQVVRQRPCGYERLVRVGRLLPQDASCIL